MGFDRGASSAKSPRYTAPRERNAKKWKKTHSDGILKVAQHSHISTHSQVRPCSLCSVFSFITMELVSFDDVEKLEVLRTQWPGTVLQRVRVFPSKQSIPLGRCSKPAQGKDSAHKHRSIRSCALTFSSRRAGLGISWSADFSESTILGRQV